MTLLCVCHCPRHRPQPLDTPLPSAEGPPLAKAPRTLTPSLCKPATRVPSVRASLCKPGSKPRSKEVGTRGSRAASAPLVEPRSGQQPPSRVHVWPAWQGESSHLSFSVCMCICVCGVFFFLLLLSLFRFITGTNCACPRAGGYSSLGRCTGSVLSAMAGVSRL